MIHMLLTKVRSGVISGAMKTATLPILAASVAVLSACVTVKAPDKPIEINLNVNIRQEVIYTLKQDANALITDNPELFPK